MSLITGISKVFSPKTWNYVKRAVKAAPEIIFENGTADVFVKETNNAIKNGIKNGGSWKSSIWNGLKNGGKAMESTIAKNAASGNIFKRMFKSLKELPSVVSNYTKAGSRAAKMAGKSSILGGTKGFFKGLGKKMPLIGNLMLIAFELPNIIKATKEQGITQGAAEVAKSGTRLVGATIGGSIGSMICPGIGSIAGFFIGDWLTSKLVGKSYTEKQDELAQKQQEALETLQQMGIDPTQQQATVNPQVAFGNGMTNPQLTPVTNTNPFVPYQNPYDMMNGNYYGSAYADDIMMKGMNFNTLG